jgi:hypothetical protein
MTTSQYSLLIYQASGMVSVQVGCTLDEALVKMEARARSHDHTLEAVALAVIERRTRFS